MDSARGSGRRIEEARWRVTPAGFAVKKWVGRREIEGCNGWLGGGRPRSVVPGKG